MGAKAAGRGGASTAVADDAMAAARNPALLARLRGSRFDGTLILYGERIRERTIYENVLDEDFSVWPIPAIAYSTDTFALDVEQGDLTDVEDPFSPGPYLSFSLLQPLQGVVAPTLSVAFQLTETISFGVSLNVLLTHINAESESGGVGGGGGDSFLPGGSLFVHYQADGTPVDPPQPFTAGTGQQVTWAEIFSAADGGGAPLSAPSAKPDPEVLIKLEDLFGVGLMGQVGFLWTPRDDLSIGLALRTPGIIFKPKGTATIDLTSAINTLENDPDVGLLIGSLVDTYLPDRGAYGFRTRLDAEADDLMLPASISLGVAWWPLPSWLLTADLRWIGWDDAFDTLELTGKTIKNRDLIAINGSTTLTYKFRLEWDDQIVFALGTTIAVNDWLLLRAGFNHGNNPVPRDTVSANGLVIEDHVTGGASLRLGRWDVDLSYVYGLPKMVRQERSAFKVEQHQLYLGVGYQF